MKNSNDITEDVKYFLIDAMKRDEYDKEDEFEFLFQSYMLIMDGKEFREIFNYAERCAMRELKGF